MDPVSIFLLVIASIFVIGIVGEIVFARTGVPDVIWLIVVGILIGPVFGLVTRPQLEEIAPFFGAVTLVVVLFDGGAELKLGELSKAAGRGTFMAIFGFVLAVVAVTPVAWLLSKVIMDEPWGWMQSLLVGTILGGSSSVVIMPALKKAGLSSRISNLVSFESAMTDVLSVVSTGACIAIAQGLKRQAQSSNGAAEAGTMLVRQFGIGVGSGVVAGVLSVLVLRRLRKSQYAYPLVLGTLMVLYAMVTELGGSAALAILAAAVMVGNAPVLSRAIGLSKTARLGSAVEGVHDEITFIIKSFFFTFIGAMLGPPLPLLMMGVLIGLVLLVARVPNVALSTAKGGFSRPSRNLIAFLMPRGMAAGVLAMMPSAAGIPNTKDLPVVVFAAVLTTILLFAGGFPILRRRLEPSDLEDQKKDSLSPAADASMSSLDARSPFVVPAGAADATRIDSHPPEMANSNRRPRPAENMPSSGESEPTDVVQGAEDVSNSSTES